MIVIAEFLNGMMNEVLIPVCMDTDRYYYYYILTLISYLAMWNSYITM